MATIRKLPPIFFLLMLAFAATSCDQPEHRWDIPRADWTSRHYGEASPQSAYDAGKYALRQWFVIGEDRPNDGLLVTAPAEYQQHGGTDRIRDAAIGYTNRMRRRAVIRVRSTNPGATVECVVTRERLDTSDHRVFAMNREFQDVPNQTPIASEGATSPRQNEVWTDVGRDRGMEHQILDVVRERLGGGGASPASAPAAP